MTVGITEIHERLFETNARIDGAWPFPASPAPEVLLEELEMHEVLPAEFHALTEGWPEHEIDALLSGRGYQAEEAWSELCGAAFRKNVSGWIGNVSCPVYEGQKDGNGASFSWGYTRSTIIFAPTADALLNAAADWAEQQYEMACAKAKVA